VPVVAVLAAAPRNLLNFATRVKNLRLGRRFLVGSCIDYTFGMPEKSPESSGYVATIESGFVYELIDGYSIAYTGEIEGREVVVRGAGLVAIDDFLGEEYQLLYVHFKRVPSADSVAVHVQQRHEIVSNSPTFEIPADVFSGDEISEYVWKIQDDASESSRVQVQAPETENKTRPNFILSAKAWAATLEKLGITPYGDQPLQPQSN
jgi:hypothetical protein